MTPIFSRFLLVMTLLLLALVSGKSWGQDTRAAGNEPTLSQIYQAANGGNVDRADAMINEVLKSHPNSAKAHYVKAELSARQGKHDVAKAELAKAESIAPGLPFVKAESAQALRNQVANANAKPAASTKQMGAPPASERPSYNSAPAQRSFPWGTLLAVGAIVAIGMMVLRRRNAAMAAGNGYGGAYGNTSAAPYGQTGSGPMYPPNAGGVPPGYGPGYPQQQPGMGSTLGRGLATGAAIGAGMMAAEALGRNVFGHGNAHAAGQNANLNPNAPSLDQIDDGMRRNLNTDMGGDNFGINDGGGWDAGGGGGDFGGGGGDWDS